MIHDANDLFDLKQNMFQIFYETFNLLTVQKLESNGTDEFSVITLQSDTIELLWQS
jgi:hypothetical protein